jgi:hypothetical protein
LLLALGIERGKGKELCFSPLRLVSLVDGFFAEEQGEEAKCKGKSKGEGKALRLAAGLTALVAFFPAAFFPLACAGGDEAGMKSKGGRLASWCGLTPLVDFFSFGFLFFLCQGGAAGGDGMKSKGEGKALPLAAGSHHIGRFTVSPFLVLKAFFFFL